MNRLYFSLLFLTIVVLLACKSENEDPKIVPDVLMVTGIVVEDVSNFANASDIRISFDKLVDESELDEYRIYVTKSSSSTALDLEKALEIDPSNYYAVAKAGQNIVFNLHENGGDVDGDAIMEGISYSIYVAALAETGSIKFTSGISAGVLITLGRDELIISGVEAFDITNSGDASDIKILFKRVSDETEVKEYRVYVTKNSSEFDLQTALQISSSNYYRLDKTGEDFEFNLPSNITDIDDDNIVENVAYHIYVMAFVESTSTNVSSGLSSSIPIILEQTSLVKTVNTGFSASGGMQIGSDGSIYIADFGTGTQNGTTILKFSPDGDSFSVFADGLLGPTGGAFDSQGNLYWSSYSGGEVHKIDDTGNVSSFASVRGPVAIVVDDSDNLIVASCDANEIVKITAAGEVSTFATNSSFNCPNGLTADYDGNLYTCNFEDGKIFKITSDGSVSDFATIPSGSSVNMTYHNGFLYLTGRNAHRIYKVSTVDQSIETLAGTGVRGNFDASALDSEFSFPNGIKFSNDGTSIFVNDVDPNSGTSFNPNILRKIELVDK